MARVESASPVTCRVLAHDEGRLLLVFNHGRDAAEARISPSFDYGGWTKLYGSDASKVEDIVDGGLAVTLGSKGVVVLNMGRAP